MGVPHSADLHSIKKAFHGLSKVLHPDITLLPVDEASEQFREVCEAYEILSDPIRRKLYDHTLKDSTLTNEVFDKSYQMNKSVSIKTVINTGNRRPLSGGELFSLMLLCLALGISLILGITFAIVNGKALYINPSWL
ncbi:J domain-containing protein [Prochlorococcus sp. MIT 0602]|uniref:J domain-containing protein n=1 Tax=Prochlorococcus sp. MIT 0602 TaxID=1499499 RepID=UPI00068E1126